MNEHAILVPMLALICWTIVMWIWMYATRIPALGKAKDVDTNSWVGGVGSDLDRMLPAKTQWVAHNYNHLHESPTIFYAVCLALAVLGAGDGSVVAIAWIYVGLRILHSLIQALWNRIVVRFAVYCLSSFALFALVGNAVLTVWD